MEGWLHALQGGCLESSSRRRPFPTGPTRGLSEAGSGWGTLWGWGQLLWRPSSGHRAGGEGSCFAPSSAGDSRRERARGCSERARSAPRRPGQPRGRRVAEVSSPIGAPRPGPALGSSTGRTMRSSGSWPWPRAAPRAHGQRGLPAPAWVSPTLRQKSGNTGDSRYFPNWGARGELERRSGEGTGSNPLVFYFKNYIFYVTIAFR